MAALEPFEPHIGATLGKTVTCASGAGALTSATCSVTITSFAPVIMVANVGATAAYFRISTEVNPSATAADIPLPANTVRLFANPNPNGNVSVAVAGCTVSNSGVSFTPGQGGL